MSRKEYYGKGWSRFCLRCLKLSGWTVVGEPIPDPKAVVLGVPHTSMKDFVLSYLLMAGYGRVPHVMIKKELFFWPLGPVLRALGCIPVDRSNATTLVKSLIDSMNASDDFLLAVAPEGTRKPVKHWKAGSLAIAARTGVPVYAGYIDYCKKHISFGEKFPLAGEPKEDMKRLQEYYETLHLTARHPEKYITR